LAGGSALYTRIEYNLQVASLATTQAKACTLYTCNARCLLLLPLPPCLRNLRIGFFLKTELHFKLNPAISRSLISAANASEPARK